MAASASRTLTVTTPLGPDALNLVGFTGNEALSQLFQFKLDLVADNDKDIDFAALLGENVTIHLAMADDKARHFSGICNRISQGDREDLLTTYRMEIVPQFWLLTKRVQSRIFQHITVPDILKKVLQGLKVTWDIQGTFQPRDYCVQYRESDFHFACRMMEEEGIYYFFKHTEDGHEMVVANTPSTHPGLPEGDKVIYEAVTAGEQREDRIFTWEKGQEVRSGKVTLWDHCFELPHKHLETEKAIQDTSQAGKVNHKLKVAKNDKLEIYQYPGEYAQRFDGVDRGGGDKAGDLQKIFDDNKRTVGIRMQQEAAPGLVIHGAGTCRRMVSGHKFTLERHFNGDGEYVVTSVQHSARDLDYRSGNDKDFRYENTFTCIPMDVPYRPPLVTEKPTVHGSQTAVVVGPAGEEIFCDKYSRVKVQFHWDREGKNNADSSCWCRVSTLWAGKQWGVIHIPRIGQEVIVDFLEGDPDQPIITGSVYNAEMMPPYGLPDNKTQSGVKSRSSLGGTPDNFNEIRFEDKKGSEQVYIHAEKNQDIEVENDETHWVGRDRKKTIDRDEKTLVKRDRTETVDRNETITVHGARTEVVDKDETITIHSNRTETVDKNETITIHANRTETVDKEEKITIGGGRTENVAKDESITIGGSRKENVAKDESIKIGGGRSENVSKDESISIGGGRTETVGDDQKVRIGKNDTLNVGNNLNIVAGDSITLKTGAASITMKKDGTILIKGKDITVKATGEMVATADKNITMKGKKILQN